MHTRRVITFLLGIWIGGGILVNILALENFFYSTNLVLNAPQPAAAKMIAKLGPDDARLLLRHFAAEQTRNYLTLWEDVEIAIGVVLILIFALSEQSRNLPLIFIGLMWVSVLFQHYGIVPEWSYRGRETDFPPGSLNFAAQARVWTLGQIYVGAEVVKLLIGGVLTSYLFVFNVRSRSRRRASSIDSLEVEG